MVEHAIEYAQREEEHIPTNPMVSIRTPHK